MSKPPSNDSIGFRELLPIAFWVVKIHLALARKWTIVSALSRFLAELRPIVYTYIIAQLINQVIITASSGDNLEDLTIYLVALFVYGLVSRTVGFIEGYANTRLNWDIDTGLRRMLYSKMHSLGVQTLEQPGVVNRATRAKENIQHVQRYMFDLIKFFGSLVRMTSTGAIIFSVIPAAGALLLVFAIPKALIQKHFMKKDWHIHRDMTEGRRKAHAAAGMLTEASVHEISVLNAFRHIDRIFIGFYTKYIGRVMHNRKRWDISEYLISLVVDIVVVWGYFKILEKAFDNAATLIEAGVGDILFQFNMLDNFNSSFERITRDLTQLQERAVRIKESKGLFEMEPLIKDGTEEFPALVTAPGIELKNVNFTYPSAKKAVIKGLNLNISPGEKIAIVGHNGAGKTTLVKLLARFYQVSKGELLINGQNINDIRIADWYRNIGILFQEYNRYDFLSAEENIAIGDISREDKKGIREAAKMADAHELINEFEFGYDQILSEKYEGGTRPSSGQWQKIAIARFFYRNAPVVIFDEPTAAIDAVAEYRIFNKIYEFFTGKTVIIISHRFSTVRNADRIIVFEKGKIAEQGSHDELMAMNGKYAEAFRLQAEGYS